MDISLSPPNIGIIMYTEQNFSLTEVSAEVYNKLQAAKTVLELLKTDKRVSKEFIDLAIKDLEKIVNIIS